MNAQRTPDERVAKVVNDMSRFLIIELPALATHEERELIARRVAAAVAVKPPVAPAPSRAAENINAVGRWVGKDLWWDIEGESISDHELKRWCYLHLPEPWNTCNTGIVNYHTAAYKHRRDAIREYLK
jgi:hypothetical protein